MEQGKLTDEQRLYLQAIFDHFYENGEWSTYMLFRTNQNP